MKRISHILTLLLLLLTPMLLISCSKTTKDIKIVTDLEGEQFVSMYVGEEKQIVFNVLSLPKSASGRLMFTKDSASISEPIAFYNAQTHENTITFQAITKCRVEIRAIAEGGNQLSVIVQVFEKVQDFHLREQLILVRGDEDRSQINLGANLFKFEPEATDQTQLIFRNAAREEITTLNIDDYAEDLQNFEVFAYSPHLDEEKIFEVLIVNKIEVFDFYLNHDDEKIISKQQQTETDSASKLFLSYDHPDFAIKEIYAQVSETSQPYSISFLKNSHVSINFEESEGEEKHKFSISALEIGSTEIVFEVFYKHIDKSIYKLQRSIKVEVVKYANEILVNNQPHENIKTQLLHTGHFSSVPLDLNLTLYPSAVKYDRVEFSYNASDLGEQPISDFIEFKQGQTLLKNVEEFDFNAPITARGLKHTQDQTVWLIVDVFYGSEFLEEEDLYSIRVEVPFIVKAGASQLKIENTWQDRRIFVDASEPTAIFKGIYVDEENAYLDDVVVTALTAQSNSRVQIQVLEAEDRQTGGQVLPLKIYTISPGESRWRITLANGVNTTLTIIAVPKLNNFTLDFDRQNSSTTTDAKYDEDGNINFLRQEMTFVEGQYQVQTRFKLAFDIDESLLKNSEYFELISDVTYENAVYNKETNHLIVSKIEESGLTDINIITFTLTAKKVDNFLLVDPTDSEEEREGYVFEYPVRFDAYLPLNSISFSNNKLNLYSENQLGFNYKHESRQETKLNFKPVAVKSLTGVEIEYSSSEQHSFDENTKLLTVDNYGTYNTETGVFTLDITGSSNNSFDVYAKVTYFGRVYLTKFEVNPMEYKRANGIRFTSYTPSIYLDPTFPTQEVNVYVVPHDAVHKEIDFQFQADIGSSADLLSFTTNQAGKIVVTYNSKHDFKNEDAGGWLYIMPRASRIDDTSIPTDAARVRVDVGTGSKQSPFLISTAQQLLNISISGLDKHYKINNKIDLSHVPYFTPLGVLTGSIVGGEMGEISGLNIKRLLNNKAGLFTELASGAEISNLKISGSIDIELTTDANVGLVAGVIDQNAKLTNLSVTLHSSTVLIKTNESVNVGGVTGRNSGTISNKVSENNKTYSNLLTTNGIFNVLYGHDTAQERSFVGGVAGVNEENGVIKQIYEKADIKAFNTANYFVFVNINIEEQAGSGSSDKLKISVGALVGENISEIYAKNEKNESLDTTNHTDFMKVGGKITTHQADNIVGGLVGENTSGGVESDTKLYGIISRVKLYSKGDGASEAYLGGAFGLNNGGAVSNLLLQALEDGVSLGLDATMIYSEKFGITKEAEPVLDRVDIIGFNSAQSGIFGVWGDEDFRDTNNLNAVTYIAHKEGNPSHTRRSVVDFDDETKNLGKYYGDLVVANIIRETFDIAEEVLEIDESQIKNQMKAEGSTLLMANLKYYKASKSDDQGIIEEAGLNLYNLPFTVTGEVALVSLNPSIVSITTTGQLLVRGTGVAAIQVYSLLNRKVFRQVYIFASYATNSFKLYAHSISGENELSPGKPVSVTTQNPVNLVASFSQENITIDNYDIGMPYSSSNYLLEKIKDENQTDEYVEFVKQDNSYALRAVNQPGANNFEIKAQLYVEYNGKLYLAVAVDEGGDEKAIYLNDYKPNQSNDNEEPNEPNDPKDISVTFTAKYYVGATKVTSSTGGLLVEPVDEFAFEFELETDMFEFEYTEENLTVTDFINISQYKQGVEGNDIDDYFELVNTGAFYNISLNPDFDFTKGNKYTLTITHDEQSKELTIEVLAADRVRIDGVEVPSNFWLNMSDYFSLRSSKMNHFTFELSELSEEMSVPITQVFKLNKIRWTFAASFKEGKLDGNYQGDYALVAQSASNPNVITQIEVKVAPQSIGTILLSSFEGSTESDIAKGKEEHNFVDPTANNRNHFRVSVYPLYAEYDYIEIEAIS